MTYQRMTAVLMTLPAACESQHIEQRRDRGKTLANTCITAGPTIIIIIIPLGTIAAIGNAAALAGLLAAAASRIGRPAPLAAAPFCTVAA